jgi:hypothetical protein
VKDFFTAEWAILVLLKFSSDILTILCRSIILAFTFCALKSDDINSCLLLATHSILYSLIYFL